MAKRLRVFGGRFNFVLAVLFVLGYSGSFTSEAFPGECTPGCFIRTVIPNSSGDCGYECSVWNYTFNCDSYVSYINRYACAPAGSGEAGKTICTPISGQIGTRYYCEPDINWAAYTACLAASAGCGAVCGAGGPINPACVACLVGVSATCIAGYCTTIFPDCKPITPGTPQIGQVNAALSGDVCEG